MRIFEIASAFTARISRWLIIGGAAAMMGCLLLGIFFRYVVGSSLDWTGEMALFLFTWVVLLAGSLGVREGYHVRLTLFSNMLPPKAKWGLDLVTHLIVVAFGGVALYSGYLYVDQTLGQVSAAVRYPIEYLYLAAPICGGLIVLHTLAHLIAMFFPGAGGARHG